MTKTIDARGIYYRQLNEMIRELVAAGERHIKVVNVRGQRYIGSGLTEKDLLLEIEGVPGDDLAFCLGGPTVIVRGHGQNAVANTMDSGTVVMHGMGGDALAYGMRGGNLFIRDNAGYRVGIHMKEFKTRRPAIVIGGTTGDFLGEYMAGGTIVVLNRGNSADSVVGQADKTLATGIHGGALYIFNYAVPAYMPGIGAKVSMPNGSDYQQVKPLVEEFCRHFELDAEAVLSREMVKIVSADSRPFGKFYSPAYPVDCGVIPEQREMASPCEAACPVGIPTGRFLGHIRHGEYSEAFALIDSYTPFRYSNCGFICSHRCMEACSRGKVDLSIQTSELARSYHGNRSVEKVNSFKGEIAVIGAGPAGLSSAYFLARLGYTVDVYEAAGEIGGKMRQVISRSRLPLEDLEKDLRNIAALGINFHLGEHIDSGQFNRLVAEKDHVIVAIGAHQPLLPPVKGRELIRPGLDFLKKYNLGEKIALGKSAVIIGCGDAAMDGIEAVVNLGLDPKQITVLDVQTPSANAEELNKWINSGVKVLYPYYLQEINEKGVIARDSGGGDYFIAGDTFAFINEAPRFDFLPDALNESLNRRGFFEANDQTGATVLPSVSITGDATGLGLVANSIRKGRECANRIHAELQGLEYIPEQKEAIDSFDLHLHTNEKNANTGAINFRDEYLRCLHCGVCIRCDECVEACPRQARTREGTEFMIDLKKCGGCGTCAATCKGGVIRMVPRTT